VDQFYFEEGYLEASYFTVIREAEAALPMAVTVSAQGDIADTTGYYIPDYIVTDYFESGGQVREADAAFTVSVTQAVVFERITQAVATVSVSVSKTCTVTRIRDSEAAFTAAFAPTLTADAFKNHTAVLDSVSTMSVDAVANRSANVLLEHIADLNAMAAKTVDVNSSMAVIASQSTTANTNSSAQVTVTSTVTLTAAALKIKSASASLSVVSGIFVSRNVNGRPRDFTITGTLTFDTSIKKFGTASYFYDGQGFQYTNYLTYASTSDWSKTKTIDFWWYHQTQSGSYLDQNTILSWYTDSNNFKEIKISPLNTGLRQIVIDQTIAGVSTEKYRKLLTAASYPNNNWYHFRILDDGSSLTVWLDGTRIAKDSGTYIAGLTLNAPLRLGGFSSKPVRFDELLITQEILTASSVASFTPPGRWTPTDQTNILLLSHFDQTYIDDVTLTQSVSAGLSTASTITAQANANTKLVSADLSASSTVSAIGVKLQSATADLVSATAITAVVERTRLSDSNLNTVTAVTAVIGSVKQFDCDAGALFAPQITVTAQLAGVALLETTTTVTAQAVKTTDLGATLNTTTSMSVSATVSAELASVQTVTTAATVTVTRARETVVDLDTAVTVTADSLKIAGVDITAATSTTLIATADKLKLAEANLSTAITADITAQKTTSVTVSVESEFTQVTDYIRIRSADITESVTVTVTASPVKTPGIGVAVTVTTVVTAQAVKTVDSIVLFGALFAPQITADITARPLVFLETSSAVTVQPGYLIQYPPTELFSTGLDTSTGSYEIELVPPQSYNPDFGSGYVMAFWAKRDTITTGNYAYSMLAPTTFGNSAGQYNLLQFKNGTGPTSGGITRSYAHSITLFTPWNLQSNPYWDNTVSQDTDWHHYLIRYVAVSSGGGTLHQYTLYVDGVSQGTSNGSNALRVNSGGGVYFGTGWSSPNPTANTVAAGNFDGAMAQVWLGGVTNFNIEQFYRTNTDSAVDLTGFESPEQYNLLTDPWSGVTAGDNTTLTASTEPLFNGRIHSKFTISGSIVGVFLFEIPLSAVTGLACTASAILRTGQNLTVTVTETVTATTAIGIVADLPVVFAQDTTVFRIQTADSAIAAAFTQTVQPGLFEQATADLVSTVILDAGVDSIPPTRGEAELSSSFQLTAQVTSFTDSITLLVTAGTLTADVTVIPPVRVEADLVVTASMSVTIGSIEQFAVLTVSSGTLSCSAVKTTDSQSPLTVSVTQSTAAFKFTGVIANFTAFNSQLTVGEIINIDPFLQLKIEPETRINKIPQESRVFIIESETRVNIIKD
jgi:hypothetical protein